MADLPLPAPLRRLRRARGWSHRELAQQAGVSPDTILDLERRWRTPRPATMKRIADALGVRIVDVVEFRNGPDGEEPMSATGVSTPG